MRTMGAPQKPQITPPSSALVRRESGSEKSNGIWMFAVNAMASEKYSEAMIV